MAALDALFTTMEEHMYKLGGDKLWLAYQELKFLGHLLRSGTLQPDPDSTKAIAELLPPTTRTELRAFLGITGYYRMFVYRYALLAKPLTELLKDDTPWQWETK